MSLECDIAAKVVEKRRLQQALNDLTLEIKELWYGKEQLAPYAVEYDGYAVTVKRASEYTRPSEYGIKKQPKDRPMPITTVAPLIERCVLTSDEQAARIPHYAN